MQAQIKHPVVALSLAFVFLFYLFSSTTVVAQADAAVWDRFSDFDPESEVTVNHLPLSEVLNGTVFPVGNSKRKLGAKAKTENFTGSRIVSSTTGNPSRYEGNRLLVHAFDDNHKTFFRAYQEGLERLSERRALSTLNKDEQLAYWLNLYNVILINKLIEEYPIKKLKKWRVSKKGNVFWNEKVTTVEGVLLSLRDIELIIFNNWESPLVMYGLFQGTIGGPSLLTQAFTGENVWQLLNENAVEFINSNRGIRTKGSRIDVSLMYEWALPLFDNSQDRVLSHIRAYGDPAFHGDFANITSIRYKTYNWVVADLLGGTLHKGQHSQLGGVLTAGTSTSEATGTRTNMGITHLERDLVSASFSGLINRFLAHEPLGPQTVIPVQAQDLITEMLINNNMPERIPNITITDCEQEGGCIEVPVSSEAPEDTAPGTNAEPDDPNLVIFIAGQE